MDLGQYTKLFKFLTIIPVVVSILTFVEGFLPYKTLRTAVEFRSKSYSIKTGITTYTIHFKGIDDQFPEEIYNNLLNDEKVDLKLTYFNKQIIEVVRLSDNKTFINSTSESYAIYAFAIVYLLSGLVWLSSGYLKNRTAIILAFIILFSAIQLVRMF